MWRLDEHGFDDIETYDPLYFVRSRPLEDEEAEMIEAICQAATPGPWVTDDASEGDGALVATLPGGRHIVSTRPGTGSLEAAVSFAAANAQLICEARCLLLRFLKDRKRWKRQKQRLLKKIRLLEEQVERRLEPAAEGTWPPADQAPSRPR